MRYITTLAKTIGKSKTVRPMTSLPDSEGPLREQACAESEKTHMVST